MTVSELIEELQKQPQHLRVVVDGYEGGYGDIDKDHISVVCLKLNVNDAWYYGEHEVVFNRKENPDCDAVLICR